ncbi:MAG TPA: GNAT family N-acetyltransferase [Longimicrobium sp.]|jgi:ribosomal protein S18 acetylase RimI-like enzyme
MANERGRTALFSVIGGPGLQRLSLRADTLGNAPPPANEVGVRRATDSDLHTLGQLGALLMRMHHESDPRRFVAAAPGTESKYSSFLGSQLRDPNVVMLVAQLDGAVVGYAYAALEGTDCMALRGPAGVLYDIVVDPRHHRCGVGRLLLDAIVSELTSRGAPRMVLLTATANLAGQRLFSAAGFRSTMLEMTRELNDQLAGPDDRWADPVPSRQDRSGAVKGVTGDRTERRRHRRIYLKAIRGEDQS